MRRPVSFASPAGLRYSAPMSTTFTIDTATSRANPTPAPMKRLTVPAVQGRKVDGATAQPPAGVIPTEVLPQVESTPSSTRNSARSPRPAGREEAQP